MRGYKTYLRILDELGWPNIFIVGPEQFEHVEGEKWEKADYGVSSDWYPVITIRKGLKGRVLANTIYHELAHQLFPHRPHWWVYLYGYVMARGGGEWIRNEYYGHTVDDLPPRPKLLELTRRAVKRFNERTIRKARKLSRV